MPEDQKKLEKQKFLEFPKKDDKRQPNVNLQIYQPESKQEQQMKTLGQYQTYLPTKEEFMAQIEDVEVKK